MNTFMERLEQMGTSEFDEFSGTVPLMSGLSDMQKGLMLELAAEVVSLAPALASDICGLAAALSACMNLSYALGYKDGMIAEVTA